MGTANPAANSTRSEREFPRQGGIQSGRGSGRNPEN